ncbi:MAG: SDR family oxidoreductase [Alphaproteobacteria bacterium]
MAGKRGLVLGIANDHSIAWGIARTLAAHGAALAITHQGETFARRVIPLAESLGAAIVADCDVEDESSLDALFARINDEWGGLDFIVHSIAYSDKSELAGQYLDTTRDNFVRTMMISCFSFTAIARRAAPLMTDGGGMLTLTYSGSERVMPQYNVMGVAKAALEASVRSLAVDLGDRDIRVNAISAGPMRTLAGSAIGAARQIHRWSHDHSPLQRNVTLDEIGGAALYLLSRLSGGVTGEIHHVDAGYNIISVPALPRDEGA